MIALVLLRWIGRKFRGSQKASASSRTWIEATLAAWRRDSSGARVLDSSFGGDFWRGPGAGLTYNLLHVARMLLEKATGTVWGLASQGQVAKAEVSVTAGAETPRSFR